MMTLFYFIIAIIIALLLWRIGKRRTKKVRPRANHRLIKTNPVKVNQQDTFIKREPTLGDIKELLNDKNHTK